MTSARKIKTNRVNAKACTGPKTTQGKVRAAQNARRHGLSSSVLADPFLSAEVRNRAREIAGEGVSHEILNTRNALPKHKSMSSVHARRGMIFFLEISMIRNLDLTNTSKTRMH
jgi:hypothetical protein